MCVYSDRTHGLPKEMQFEWMNEQKNRILLSGILLLFLGIEKRKKRKNYTRGSNGSRVRCVNIVNKIHFLPINSEEYSLEKKILYENCFCIPFYLSSRLICTCFEQVFSLTKVLLFHFHWCISGYLIRTSSCFSFALCFSISYSALYQETVSKLSIIYIGLCIVATGSFTLHLRIQHFRCRKLCTSVGVIGHCVAVSG